MYLGDNLVDNGQDIVNEFAKYFSSVYVNRTDIDTDLIDVTQ